MSAYISEAEKAPIPAAMTQRNRIMTELLKSGGRTRIIPDVEEDFTSFVAPNRHPHRRTNRHRKNERRLSMLNLGKELEHAKVSNLVNISERHEDT